MFDGNGDGVRKVPDAQSVVPGRRVVEPIDRPTREGYTFISWCTDAACQKVYDFNTPVFESFTLYAKWATVTHTVSFDSNGGSPVDTQTVEHGGTVDRPQNPTRDDVFVGWYDADGKAYDFNSIVTSDLTLTARWAATPSVEEALVVFDSNGGSEIPATTVTKDSPVQRPMDPPTRESCSFDGWFTAADGGKRYDFDLPVTENLVLYARWVPQQYTVTFDRADGSATTSVKVESGSSVAMPEDPTRDGYVFTGWYNENTLYDFATPVTVDLMLTAHWYQLPATHTVTFDSDGGSAVDAQTVEDGGTVTAPTTAPVREGHTFTGWYLDGKLYDFATPVTTDLTLTGYWIPVSCSVTFDADGGTSTPATQTRPYGGFATVPDPQPTKDNFVLDGWYEDVDLGEHPLTKDEAEEIQNDLTLNLSYWVVADGSGGYTLRIEHDFDSDAILGDTELHARWISATHTVSFDLNGGNGDAPNNQSISHGAQATEPTARPVRDGYLFAGWYNSKTCEEGSSFDFDCPITSDLTLYAGWTSDYHVVTFVAPDCDMQAVAHDQKATRPAEVPTRSGCTFDDWYADEGCTDKFNFDTPITRDTTVLPVEGA